MPKLAGVELTPSMVVHNFGVLLETSVLLDDQMASMARGANYQLRQVRQLQSFLEKRNFAIVIHALSTS